MDGLREKKKKEREERIFTAAIQLFNRKGFSQTTMKDIAQMSRLGVGTLYNYFPSKNDLLLEIMEKKLDQMENESQNFIEKLLQSKDNGVSILKKFIDYYLNYFFMLNKDIWNEAFMAFFSSSSYIQRGMRMDMRIISDLQNLLDKLQKKGLIASDVDTESASFIIYSTLAFQFMGFILFPDMKKEQFYQNLYSQLDLIYKGIKP
ncbi:TetR/AcrR family transcriptional regulator [bacterium]|nr:TetR/AcrR family transcriptional regulator [bacterium]